jgi:hypothetical protein
MKVIVDSQEEAIEVSRALVKICNDMRYSNLDPMLQPFHEQFLCSIRDSIEIAKEKSHEQQN